MKTIISIADIHFGAIDPKFEYETLKRDFTDRIKNINFDILAICGDLFDSKMMSNNPAISYAMRFIDDLVQICTNKLATLILLEGTQSHDAGQLSLFYHYLHNHVVDMRIVENMKFEIAHGLKILCIPEKYDIPVNEYKRIFYESGGYDLTILHGTYRGSFHGTEIATLETNHAPIFGMNNFEYCAGPILMGHYHIPGCYDQYAYYNGSAMRYQFGQEEEKGFLITVYNENSRQHYTELISIKSHSYITININSIINNDPKYIIEYIKNEKQSRGIDYIRVQYNNSNENMTIVRNYFRNSSDIKLDELRKKDIQKELVDKTILETNKEYQYIIDDNIPPYDKFIMYINQSEGDNFITVDELVSLLEEEI